MSNDDFSTEQLWPLPPPQPLVKVRALPIKGHDGAPRGGFCVAGRPVSAGEIVEIEKDAALTLIAFKKAELV